VNVSLHTSSKVEEITAAKVQSVSENRSTDESFGASNRSCELLCAVKRTKKDTSPPCVAIIIAQAKGKHHGTLHIHLIVYSKNLILEVHSLYFSYLILIIVHEASLFLCINGVH